MILGYANVPLLVLLLTVPYRQDVFKEEISVYLRDKVLNYTHDSLKRNLILLIIQSIEVHTRNQLHSLTKSIGTLLNMLCKWHKYQSHLNMDICIVRICCSKLGSLFGMNYSHFVIISIYPFVSLPLVSLTYITYLSVPIILPGSVCLFL